MRTALMFSLLALSLGTACNDPREQFGRTWYLDGAGNWGFGVVDVPSGLEEAGYHGYCSNFRWSMTFNPALDQTLRFIAHISAANLGKEISDYLDKHPGADANVIALSAGTGVGIWGIEDIRPPHKINNFVLLGSSLSSSYDCRPALKNMIGNMYVYHASHDPVLSGPVRVVGTIDGKFDEPAGLVGMRGPGRESGRIINISWSERYSSLGWTGGHTDCVNHKFVCKEIAPRILVHEGKPHEKGKVAATPVTDASPPPTRRVASPG